MIVSPLLQKISWIAHGFGTIADPRPANAVTVKQVHGVAILEPEAVPTSEPEDYDTVLTDRPGLSAAVKTADCQPILMVETEKKIVAAVHAGWKGTLLRAAQAAIRRIEEKGGKAENLVCALGPNMAGRCFEVEADVAGDFAKEFPGWPLLKRISETKWLLDVAQANRLQLKESGVADTRIDRIDLCTHCCPDLFWSYRRDGEKAGRMVNFIQILG
ncbi:MAG TPA: peptidoglycan editing factor PgeF [bacterium]|nr:peptidoglycan editing factor PgeF [bacterium]